MVTPEIGIACSRACLAKARRILLERGARRELDHRGALPAATVVRAGS